MPELKKILKGCLAGNKRDQELLYRRYSSKLYGVSLQYSGSYDEARDVLQESFIKIFTSLQSFHGKGSFEGWMRRIVVNTALERHRNRYYLNKVDDPGYINNTLPGMEADDFETMESEDLLNFIMDLPPKYRMVFNLYAIEGYSHKEISAMLGISQGTSKSNLSRARTILQKKVEKHLGIKKRMNG
ncbi:MAG TPA: RNA polymerase sigma factor [Bacteroidales bacterium]|nr:RNA polymerase sigma factor [Bacteroidales bacterium]